MDCLCGKPMQLISASQTVPPDPLKRFTGGDIKIWACPPDGCGRIFLESAVEIGGTYYQPEQNTRRDPF